MAGLKQGERLNEAKERMAANSVFIKLWLDVKHLIINCYFAFVVN
jgi:hypothetical protein